MALYDSLTGLANRHRMSRRLDTTLTAYQIAKRSCALMMIDLDRFKAVNDTLGHQAGDELLKQVAQRLSRVIGNGAEIGRLGGDEFQVILPDIDDRGQLGEIAQKIIPMVSQPYSIDGSRCVIGASVGIAIAPYDGLDSEELVRSADLALYAAKGGGRGRYRFYSSDLQSVRRGAPPARGGHARRAGQRTQTATCTTSRSSRRRPNRSFRVRGADALAPSRARADLAGAVHPDRRGAGLIARSANGRCARPAWKRPVGGRGAGRGQRLADPVRPLEPARAGRLGAGRFAACDPTRLELEITESVFLGEGADTQAMFTALKKLGVRLALDDFGTGYSSLGYLQQGAVRQDQDRPELRARARPSRATATPRSSPRSSAWPGRSTWRPPPKGSRRSTTLDLMRKLGVSHVQGYVFSQAGRR